jgi:anthranilate phosphoribosyltransferase
MTPQEALSRCIEHREIFEDEMRVLMTALMRGELSPVVIAGLLMGLRVKKETVGEIAAAARVTREFATRVEVADTRHLVDVVGTGGDGAHTFNISTAAAFVVAAAGGRVAKHGNRAVSSRSGSADVLEALGAHIELPPPAIAQCIAEVGVGFMFAPAHHAAWRHAAAVRKELGVRTVFNILGPLTNPAGAPAQLVGVFHADLVGILVRVLARLGARRAMAVWGTENLDELSVSAPTMVGELLADGSVREYVLTPQEVGLATHNAAALRVESVEESRDRVLGALEGTHPAARDVVALNAGAALYLADRADSHAEGVALALETIGSGAARARLDAFVARTRSLVA